MASTSGVKLLKTNSARIAYAIARQIQKTVPSYKNLDRVALATNVQAVLAEVEKILRRNEARSHRDVLELLLALREMSGFSTADFLVAVLCGLPVLRRFFLQHASSIERGIELYEEVEAILIPVYGQIAARLMGVNPSEEATARHHSMPVSAPELHTDGEGLVDNTLLFEIMPVK